LFRPGSALINRKDLKSNILQARIKVKDFVRKLFKGGGKKKALSRLNDSDTVKPATEPNLDPTDVGPGSAANTGVQANKAAGDAMRDIIAKREAPALTEVNLWTDAGRLRRADVLKLGDEVVEIESKVGRTGLTSRTRQELARDWWLKRQNKVDDVWWEFSQSDVTDKLGPTRTLQEKLDKLGFRTIIND